MYISYLLEILKDLSLNLSSAIIKFAVRNTNMEFKRVLGNEIKWSYAFKFPLCQSFDLTEYVDTRNLTPWLFWFTFNESYVKAG